MDGRNVRSSKRLLACDILCYREFRASPWSVSPPPGPPCRLFPHLSSLTDSADPRFVAILAEGQSTPRRSERDEDADPYNDVETFWEQRQAALKALDDHVKEEDGYVSEGAWQCKGSRRSRRRDGLR